MKKGFVFSYFVRLLKKEKKLPKYVDYEETVSFMLLATKQLRALVERKIERLRLRFHLNDSGIIMSRN